MARQEITYTRALDWMLTADAELRPILDGGVNTKEQVGAALHAIEKAMHSLTARTTYQAEPACHNPQPAHSTYSVRCGKCPACREADPGEGVTSRTEQPA
jgi:hypothetical protein